MEYREGLELEAGPKVLGIWLCPDDTAGMPELLLLKSDTCWNYYFDDNVFDSTLSGPSWIEEARDNAWDETFFSKDSKLLLPVEFL